MISFESDYVCGAHPKILENLALTNMESLSGYGVDKYCESAKEKIKKVCGKDVDVEFLVGGTQTNSTVIAAMLNDYEGVVSAQSGHINVHESGAVEYTGHKVLSLPQHNGKLDAAELKNMLTLFHADGTKEHMVFPGMVYISHPTEYGTLYTKKELTDISAVCKEYSIPLFLDGARLGYGLMSNDTDVSLKDIVELTDVFYFGGTKVGALCGEAVVFTHNNKPKHFTHSVKKRGALLAKGRLLGVQFDTLFTDDLYFKISKNAIDLAEELKVLFAKKGIPMYVNSPTNQQFVILENDFMKKISDKVAFSVWEPYDENHTVVRFATSWATTHEDIVELEKEL